MQGQLPADVDRLAPTCSTLSCSQPQLLCHLRGRLPHFAACPP